MMADGLINVPTLELSHPVREGPSSERGVQTICQPAIAQKWADEPLGDGKSIRAGRPCALYCGTAHWKATREAC
jgi:hypothetical protein